MTIFPDEVVAGAQHGEGSDAIKIFASRGPVTPARNLTHPKNDESLGYYNAGRKMGLKSHFVVMTVLICALPGPVVAQDDTGRVFVPSSQLPRIPSIPAPRQGQPRYELPKPSTPGMPADVDWFPHKDGETPLAAWIRKNQQVQQPSQPQVIATTLVARAAALSLSCTPLNQLPCRQRDALLAAAAGLRAGVAAADDCEAAAKAFSPHYRDADPPEATARQYDLACLGSIQLRRNGAGVEATAAPPPIIADGLRYPAQGVLAMIGILERDGIPICGSLIRPDRTVVTARHCYDKNRSAFDAQSVTVRPASGTAGPWSVAGVRSKPSVDSDAAADDWIVLAIGSAPGFAAPASTFAPMPLAGEVTVLGHFAHYKAVGYQDDTLPGWRKGLRYPRMGLCQSVQPVRGCLQIACQTVRGFSGAPVFLPAAGADGRPQVVGFISQDYSAQANCPPALIGATLAVAAGQIE